MPLQKEFYLQFQINIWNNGGNSPSVEMAVKIARAFDVPVDYLLGVGKYAAYDKDTSGAWKR